MNKLSSTLSFISKDTPIAIISDSIVAKLYGDHLKKELIKKGYLASLFTFPAGEAYKTRETKEKLENAMLKKKLNTNCLVIALGGGITNDIAGFIASTYCRGVPYVSIPTTLLAMCDSSIGGKNGVNCAFGKNLIGTFYEPLKVIVDFNFLNTLSEKEMREGLAEVIKHALIEKPALFSYLEKNRQALFKQQNEAIEKIVKTSISIKQKIVNASKKTKNKRNLLNFGHTVAHALEISSNYTISHGEAVAFGILKESKMAELLGVLSATDFKRIENLLTDYGYLLNYSKIPVKTLIKNMALDKKAINGSPRFVILNKIGSCSSSDGNYCQEIDEAIIQQALAHL